MKDKPHSFRKSNNRLFAFLFLIVLVILLLVSIIPVLEAEGKSEISYSFQSIEYLEDAAGDISLEELLIGKYDESFLQKEGNTLAIGQSRSVWWIRLNLDGMTFSQSAMYLSIINPTVEKAVLYLPNTLEGEADQSGRYCKVEDNLR